VGVTTIDLRYTDIDAELWALGQMLDTIEPTVERLARDDEKRIWEELKERGSDQDEAERDFAYQEVREKRDYVLPRFVRGPFVVALWACFESSVAAVAGGLQHELGVPIRLRELKADSFLSGAHRYFGSLLGLALDEDEARYGRLADLRLVRNALAHANGLREWMSREQWVALERSASRQGVELDKVRGVLLLAPAYTRNAYSDVEACLRSLVRRARATRPKDR
jgi:hypothetical protein